MEEHISRKAVLTLVVLALVVSVLSTALVLNAASRLPQGSAADSAFASPTATAQLTVPAQPPTAKVVLSVG